MPILSIFKRTILLIVPLTLLLASCGEQHVCEGLNNRTGSANNARNARKGNRGGYKSPREVEARDRQHKRLKHRQKQSGRKSRGGGNTTGRKFGMSSDFDINMDAEETSGSVEQ